MYILNVAKHVPHWRSPTTYFRTSASAIAREQRINGECNTKFQIAMALYGRKSQRESAPRTPAARREISGNSEYA
jgi:hypothetical protein